MRNFLRSFLLSFLMIAVIQSTILSGRAQAMDQDTKTLVRGGTYGLIGGTIVGAAVLPLTGSVRGVFIGSSLGLYMGLLMGVYRITHRDDTGGEYRSGEVDSQVQRAAQIVQSTKSFRNPKTPMEMPLKTRFAFSMPVVRF